MASRNWKQFIKVSRDLSCFYGTLCQHWIHNRNCVHYVGPVVLFNIVIIHENVQRAKCLDVHKLFTTRLASSIF